MADIASVVVGVVGCVTQCLSPSVERRFNHWCEFKSNFKKLKKEVETLNIRSLSIQQQVDAAQKNGDEIDENVQNWLHNEKWIQKDFQKWLKRASKFIGDDQVVGKMRKDEEIAAAAGEIIEDSESAAAKKRCFKGLCPDLKLRYQLSEEAEKLKETVVNHLAAWRFDKISYPTNPRDLRISIKDYEAFESRTSTLTNVINSLSDQNVNVVGIYGMGGIGKTTLVKEVANHPETNKLFDLVILVEVTEKPNIMKIQQEIARKLDLTLSEHESELIRAGNLYRRLENEKKNILIILDNIWAHLNLQQAIGIPLGDGRRVLLTSRWLNVLKMMDSQKNFQLGFLDDAEAWCLFEKMTGHIEGCEINSVAREVANKCARLPIVIVTVARALRNRELYEWEDALQQMKTHSSENMLDIHKSIELSYSYLSPVLKKTIMLIRYANLTSIDELLMFGMGLDLFERIDKLEGRRTRVRTLVKQLKDSCLLLDSNTTNEDFSMHDVVRDAVISIASRERQVFTDELTDELVWPNKKTLAVYPSVVVKSSKAGMLPEVLECQQLKLLSIYAIDSSSRISNTFFTLMKELKVLVLTNMYLLSLPLSLRFLTNLRALGLYNCSLKDIAIIGDLEKLEILSLKDSNIRQVPAEIGHLTRLRLLDLRCQGSPNLNFIPPNVISNLSHLEELYTGDFVEWDMEGLHKYKKNASLDELKQLSDLTCLEVKINDATALPRDLLFKKLERYKITIGSSRHWFWDFTPPKSCRKFTLSLINTNIWLNDGHIMQLKGIEDLCLGGLQDMISVLYGLDKDGFSQLKYLQVEDNPNLLCIVDSMEYVARNAFPVLESLLLGNLTKLEKICHGYLTEESFSQLTEIKVGNCDKLENIFSFSIARRLQLLKSIDVIVCKNMKRIFAIEGEEESNCIREVIDNTELSQLRSLTLRNLPQLRNFCSTTPSMSQQRQDEIILEYNANVINTLFSEKVVLPNLKILELYEINVEIIWQNQCVAMSSGIQLTRLIIIGCNNLRRLFSCSIASSFIQLQHLEISKCRALEEIVVVDERKDVVFPQLQSLKMEGLENLTKFFLGDCIKFPSLKELKIGKCPDLKEFMVENVSSDLTEIPLPFFNEKVALPNLEVLEMYEINAERIWKNEVAAISSGVQNLTHLIVRMCSNLRSIVSSSIASNLVRLQHLAIQKCPALEEMIVVDDGRLSEEAAFPISNFRVEHCDKLKTLFPQNTYRKFLRLESLSVSNCGSLEVIFDFEGPNFEEKQSAVITQLRKLDINGLPHLKHVWNKDPEKFLSFQKLEMVRIVGCDTLKNIFPASVASNLSQLGKLAIKRCGMKEIVAFVANEGAKKNSRFVFPRLISLTLEDLPKFTMFCPGTYTTAWPKLSKLKVTEWEMVMNLSLKGSNKEERLQVLSGKVFPNLKKLTMKGKGISTIWQFPKDLLCKLKCLDVKFDEPTVVSSLDFLLIFDNMKMLKILGNSSASNTNVIDGMSAVIRNLNWCSDLKQILKEDYNMEHLVHLVPSRTIFPNLTTLVVSDCKELTNIVTFSKALSLGQLRRISIIRCNMITEVVVAAEGDEEKDYQIVFRKLEELQLSYLESLTSFCSAIYTFVFPSLWILVVEECSKMTSFSGGILITPELQRVQQYSRDDKGCWIGDLNTTIKMLYKGKKALSSEEDPGQPSIQPLLEEMYERRRDREEETNDVRQ